MRLPAIVGSLVALLVAGCSYSVEGSGKSAGETKPAEAPPEPAGEPVPEETKPTPAPDPKPADIKGVSVEINGVPQGIAEGIVQWTGTALLVTLRRKGDVSETNVVTVSIDHVGKGCSRRDDLVQQGLTYYPAQRNDYPIYIAPTWEGCGLNILQAEKTRGGRIVGVYDGELLRADERGAEEKVRALVKFNVTVPTDL